MPRRVIHRGLSSLAIFLIAILVGQAGDSYGTIAFAQEKPAVSSPAEFWLGVICHPQRQMEKGKKRPKSPGLMVEEVVAGSPAEQGGVKAGDILLTFAEKGLKKEEDLLAYVATSHQPKISLRIMRDGKQRTLTVTLAKRPAELAVDRLDGPPLSELKDEDETKERLLRDAAKGAFAQLHATKAREETERQESQLIARLEDGASGTIEKLPKGEAANDSARNQKIDRDVGHVKPATHEVPAQADADSATLRLQQLERRIDVIDHKLNELLKMKKSSGSKAGKKK